MANGIDFSAERIRIARDGLDGPVIDGVASVLARVDPDATDDVPDEMRTITVDDERFVVGDDAVEYAEDTGTRAEPLFENGVLVETAYARPALETLLESALTNAMGNRLCYTTPASILDATVPSEVHRETVGNIFESLGFDATPVSSGYAVVTDQLHEENFTGLGIAVERDVTSVALVYYGVPVVAFSLAKGTGWVVDRAASRTGHANDQIDSRLESFTLDPGSSPDAIESAIAQGFDELANELIEAIDREITAAEIEQTVSLPVVLAGDGAIEGYEFLLGGRFDAADLPFSIRGVRLADEPAESGVRGALVAAQEDVDDFEAVNWTTAADAGHADPGDASGHDRTGDAAAAITPPGSESVDGNGGQVELTFQGVDSTAEDDDVADEAIDRLFERLGDREDEIERISSSLEDVRDVLDDIERSTASVDELDAVTADLRSTVETVESLDEALDNRVTTDTLEDVRRDVATLDSTVTSTTESLDTIDEALEKHERERAAIESELESALESVTTDVDTRFETLESEREETVERLESTLDSLQRDLDETAEDLVSAVETLETRFDDLTAQHEAMDERIDDVDDRIADVDDRLNHTDSRFEAIDDRVEKAHDRFDSVHERVEGVDERVTSVDEQVTAVDERVATVDDQVATVSEQVATVDELIDAIDGRVTPAIEHPTDVDDQIDGVHVRLDDVDEQIDTVGNRFDAVEERFEALEDRFVGIDERFADVDDRFATVDDRLVDVSTDLELADATLSESIEENRRRVENVTSRIDAIGSTTADSTGADLEKLHSTLAAHAEELDRLQATVDDRLERDGSPIDEAVESLSATVASIERSMSSTTPSDTFVGQIDELDGRIDELDTRINDIAEETPLHEEIDSRIQQAVDRTESDVDSDQVEAIERRLERVESAHDVPDPVIDDVESIEDRVADLEAVVEEDPTAGGESLAEETKSRIADIDQRLHELTKTVDDDSTGTAENDQSASVRAGFGSILAGTGGGAIAAGGVTIATGTPEFAIASVIVGVCLVVGALVFG